MRFREPTLSGKVSVESRAVSEDVPLTFFRQCSSSKAWQPNGSPKPLGPLSNGLIYVLYSYQSLMLQWAHLRCKKQL